MYLEYYNLKCNFSLIRNVLFYICYIFRSKFSFQLLTIPGKIHSYFQSPKQIPFSYWLKHSSNIKLTWKNWKPYCQGLLLKDICISLVIRRNQNISTRYWLQSNIYKYSKCRNSSSYYYFDWKLFWYSYKIIFNK